MELDQMASHRIFLNMPVCEVEVKEDVNAILNQGSGWAGGRFCRLGGNAITHALYSWYIDQDLAAAKQWFYVAAKCIAISTTKPVGFSSLWTCHDFMFPLLSDNPELIKWFGELEIPAITKPEYWQKNSGQDSLLAQLAIKRDDDQIAILMDKLETKLNKKKTHNKKDKYDIAYVAFYRGLITGDMSKMQEGLTWLAKQQSQNPTTEDFLAFHAVVMCKLAWLRGYEVKVDSPLVPMAFMPVAPLSHYDDIYEFLKPDWVAPSPPSPEEQAEMERKRVEQAQNANLEFVKQRHADEQKKKGLLAKLFGK